MDSGQWVLVSVLAAGTVFGLNRLRVDGKVNLLRPGSFVTEAELGHPMGSAATFIQFSSPYCQPCKATHTLLESLTAENPEISHVDLQVADHLDMVNKLAVMRTPTTVLLDGKGHVIYRTEGLPRTGELTEALAKVLGA